MNRPPLRTMYVNAMQFRAKSGLTFPRVKVVSYHIPKSAGTSMVQALADAYGRRRTIGVYRKSQLQPALNDGLPTWIPSQIEVIHGMFRPHPEHRIQFPNAHFLTWVRDPIERLRSLISYWLRTDDPNDEEWVEFKNRYHVLKTDDPNTLLEQLCIDSERSATNRFYQTFFENVQPAHFDFIGSLETREASITELRHLLNEPLAFPHLNRGSGSQSRLPPNYRSLLEDEYHVLKQFKPDVYR